MLDPNSIAIALTRAGYAKVHETSKVEEFRLGTHSLYLKRAGTDHPLVIHGKYASILLQLTQIPGSIRTKASTSPYHNANMRSFDQRLNRGQKPTCYGYDFGFRDLVSLQAFLAKL